MFEYNFCPSFLNLLFRVDQYPLKYNFDNDEVSNKFFLYSVFLSDIIIIYPLSVMRF